MLHYLYSHTLEIKFQNRLWVRTPLTLPISTLTKRIPNAYSRLPYSEINVAYKLLLSWELGRLGFESTKLFG